MKLFLTVFFHFFIFHFISQEIDTIWSSSIDKLEKEIPVKIFPNSDSGYTIVKRITDEKNVVSLDILDSNNTHLFAKRVTIQGDNILKIELVNDKITLFTITHNKEKQADELNAYTLNSKGELSGTTLIASLKSNGGYLATYKVAVSPDGKKVGVVCEKAHQKEKNEELIIKILDKDLQPVLTKDYGYNLPSKKRKFNVPFINNKGSLYIVKRIMIKSNKYYLSLIKENGVQDHHDLRLKSMQIADVGCKFNDVGELIISGFYTGFGVLSFQGAFIRKYNEATLPVYREEYFLPESMILGFKSKKEISKQGGGLDKFRIKDIIIGENNTTYLIAEHLFINNKDKEVVVKERKGLAVLKFNDIGERIYAIPIRTDQIDNKYNGYWSSSIVFDSHDTLFVIYNQVGENLKHPEGVYGENTLIGTKLCKVDPNGAVSKNPIVGLYSKFTEETVLNMKTYLLSGSQHKVLAESIVKNKYYLGTLTFSEEE